jgi:hypothetical protein
MRKLHIPAQLLIPLLFTALYSEPKDVEGAVTRLKERGFASTDISAVFPNPDVTKEFAIEKNTKAPEGA